MRRLVGSGPFGDSSRDMCERKKNPSVMDSCQSAGMLLLQQLTRPRACRLTVLHSFPALRIAMFVDNLLPIWSTRSPERRRKKQKQSSMVPLAWVSKCRLRDAVDGHGKCTSMPSFAIQSAAFAVRRLANLSMSL